MFVMNARMNCMSRFLDLSLETVVMISGVMYCAGGAIRFYQLVVAFNFIAITFFSLLLDVVSVWILHSVLEFVFGVSL
jgi:xanthine/uracil/vitamin C permease (AzgA family)